MGYGLGPGAVGCQLRLPATVVAGAKSHTGGQPRLWAMPGKLRVNQKGVLEAATVLVKDLSGTTIRFRSHRLLEPWIAWNYESCYSYEWKPEAEKFRVAHSQGWEPFECYARLRHEVMHEP